MAAAEEAEAPVTIIDRVALILEAFKGPARLTLAQVVTQTGLPRSSAHRIIEYLVKIQWLPYLHELHTATGLVVHLTVLDGPEVVYLDKIGGPFGMRIPSRVGGRQPAHCTAAGKALPVGPPHAPCAAISVCGPVGQLPFGRLIDQVRGASGHRRRPSPAGRTPPAFSCARSAPLLSWSGTL